MFAEIMSIAGPLLGGLFGQDSAETAANAQSQATDAATAENRRATEAAIAEQRRQYDTSRGDLAPYRETGSRALSSLGDLLGINPSGGNGYGGSLVDSSSGVPRPVMSLYQSDPAYRQAWDQFAGIHQQQFGSGFTGDSDVATIERELRGRLPAGAQAQQPGQGAMQAPLNRAFTVGDFYADPVTQLSMQFGLDEGRNAINANARAGGMFNSGARLKELTRFGTDYAGQQAGASQQRFVGDQTNIYNRLAGVAGTGQQAANQTGQYGANMAGNVSGLMSGSGNTIGGLISGMGNARGAAAIAGGNAMGGALGSIGNYFGQQQTLDKLLNRGGITGQYPYGKANTMASTFGEW